MRFVPCRFYWDSFNPSPGLNVFQTNLQHRRLSHTAEFQSLTWVERLSDISMVDDIYDSREVSIPHLG